VTGPLGRRALAEYLGSAWLVAAVVGSGIMAERLTADDGVRLLANAAATVGPLICVILMFGHISGAHFNPVVTLAAVVRGSLPAREWPVYAITQFAGACSGAIVANLMFDLAPVTASTKVRSGTGVWLGEVVATTGLLLVIHLVGVARASWTPVAVGIWIGGAYWFTSSTSLANPAVTIARSLTDTFTGIAPGSVPAFMASQVAGLVAALFITRVLDAGS
jgi:arsenate reductase